LAGIWQDKNCDGGLNQSDEWGTNCWFAMGSSASRSWSANSG